MSIPQATELESLKARVFDSKGWNKAFVEGALIHDLWAEIERLATEVASWKAVAHDHSGRLAIQEVNLLAFRQIEHERDAAIEDVARLHAKTIRQRVELRRFRKGLEMDTSRCVTKPFYNWRMTMYENSTRSGSIAAQSNPYAEKPSAPSAPTRFGSCAGNLEAQVSHLNGLADRFRRVADRLGGAVPVEAEKAGIRGNGGCVAQQIEQSLEDFGSVTRKLEGTIQRLESL